MMQSTAQQSNYVDSLASMAANMAFYGNTPYSQALGMTTSAISDFYNCQAFKDNRKVQEYENNLAMAMFDRLDNVIKGINALIKTVSRRRFV